MDSLTVFYDGRPCYEIAFGDSFAGLADSVSSLGFGGRRIAVITDDTVRPLYADMVLEELKGTSDAIFLFSFPAGEANKQLDIIRTIYTFLIERHFDRHDLLVALGGGVVGDMTGFAAATYLRGVSFIQIPTTLLAQCDSSIGGKTGVDLDGYKNMVGAFHMPRLVRMNMHVHKTLDDRQFLSGFAEVIKHGYILDAAYYQWLLDHREGILKKDPETLLSMIRRSCEIKKQVVEEDTKEQGIRSLLNFGHCIGHAVEKAMDFKLLHGECVSIGMCAAAYISERYGTLSDQECTDVIDSLKAFGLPVKVSGELAEDRILSLMKSDKKMDNGRIRFVMLDAIGKARTTTDLDDEAILYGIRSIL